MEPEDPHTPDVAPRPLYRNVVLSRLRPAVREQLLEGAELLRIVPGAVLQEPNREAPYAYFPEDGLASVVAVMEDGSMVEGVSTGLDGFVGIPLFLDTPSTTRVIWQVPGSAYRVPAEVFKRVARQDSVAIGLMGYVQAAIDQTVQVAGCNRRHSIVRRAARWLLMTHDRVEGDTFMLTQEFLATMLGAGRPKVTVAAQRLQSAGLISYRRGTVEVRDRAGLEAAACDCYAVMAQAFPGRRHDRGGAGGLEAASS
ncbi:MAG: Crp/Fnr family transcriptional regulator [Chloroflexi bacterium]|nr:Crp/Fnr family transcriptional regulator [Chloroflexota bacterium]